MNRRKRPRDGVVAEDDEGAEDVEERTRHNEAASSSQSPIMMRDEMDIFAEEEADRQSEGHVPVQETTPSRSPAGSESDCTSLTRSSGTTSRRNVVTGSSIEPGRNPANFFDNQWNFIITFPWVDRNQFRESRKSQKVYCTHCEKWIKATRKRDLQKHSDTHRKQIVTIIYKHVYTK